MIVHSRAVWSSEVVASWVPSGEKATDRTAPVWPARGRLCGRWLRPTPAVTFFFEIIKDATENRA